MTEAYIKRYGSMERIGAVSTGSFKISEQGENMPASTGFSAVTKSEGKTVKVEMGGLVFEHGPNFSDDLVVEHKDSEIRVSPGQNVMLKIGNEYIEISHKPSEVLELS